MKLGYICIYNVEKNCQPGHLDTFILYDISGSPHHKHLLPGLSNITLLVQRIFFPKSHLDLRKGKSLKEPGPSCRVDG